MRLNYRKCKKERKVITIEMTANTNVASSFTGYFLRRVNLLPTFFSTCAHGRRGLKLLCKRVIDANFEAYKQFRNNFALSKFE